MKDEKTGDDLVSIGFVVDLDYADATTSAHDLLQQFKTHPLVAQDPRGRRARRLGRQGAARAAATGRCRSSRCPARVLVGDAGGHGRHGRAQGRPPLHQVGHARRGGDLRGAQGAARRPSTPTSSAVEESSIGKELYAGRATRASRSRRASSQGGPLVNADDRDQGQASRAAAGRGTATTRKPMFIGDTTKDSYPKPDGKYTFDKLSSVYITGNATRDDAPNHIRVQKHVPREVAETWAWMCPAGVYEIPDDAPEDGRRRRDRQLHELRAVRRDHGQGRAPDDARGRRRAALPDHLASAGRTAGNNCGAAGCCSVGGHAPHRPRHRLRSPPLAGGVGRARRPAARAAAARRRSTRACAGADAAQRVAVFTGAMPALRRTAPDGDALRPLQRTSSGQALRRASRRPASGAGSARRRASPASSSRKRVERPRRRPPSTAPSCASAGATPTGAALRKRAQRVTRACRQPDLRPDLASRRVDRRRRPDAGDRDATASLVRQPRARRRRRRSPSRCASASADAARAQVAGLARGRAHDRRPSPAPALRAGHRRAAHGRRAADASTRPTRPTTSLQRPACPLRGGTERRYTRRTMKTESTPSTSSPTSAARAATSSRRARPSPRSTSRSARTATRSTRAGRSSSTPAAASSASSAARPSASRR